jgi:hypothetical protein
MRAVGTTLAIASFFSLARFDAARAAEGQPTLAAPIRHAKPLNSATPTRAKNTTPAKSVAPTAASAEEPLRRPGMAQRAHSTHLRWAPYRTDRDTSGTPGRLAKYGREGARTANRENVARYQPSFGDDDAEDSGNDAQPAVPSIDQPADEVPVPFGLPAPDGDVESPLPGPGDTPFPGLDSTPSSELDSSPFPGLDTPGGDSPQGPGVGPAPYGDDLAQGSRFELGPCPTIEDLDPIGVLNDRIDVDTVGAMPPECGLGDREFKGRNWSLTTMTWKASAVCHKPLYFEQMALERYGHSCHPLLEPFVSGAHFFVTIPMLPYEMGMDPPWECQYPLGYYRPGNCAPHLLYPMPISLRGAIAEAGVVTGLVFILP